MRKFMKILAIFIALVLVLVGAYVAYVYLQYHRIPDNQALTVKKSTANDASKPAAGKTYSIATYNIGYGSYPPDYTFFMDGGKEVRARSKSAVNAAMKEDLRLLDKINADFVNIQEIDWDGTRSQHVNEPKVFQEHLTQYNNVLAQNYDSGWLQYPVLNPIGKAKSGIMTFSKFPITSARRYSLPIETNFNKFFDLDRAFSVQRIPMENGKDFMLYNVHLSAYTKDQSVQKAQLDKLFKSMQKEVDAGNYVICGGDYNHDLVGCAREELTWMKTFPTEDLTKGMRVVAPDPENNAPSVRSNGVTLDDPKEITGWIDGFLVSKNITDISVKTVDNGFKASDHQPVVMEFQFQ
ncbi:endonuclease/exonuclease/phosphatase family protein [Lactovum odontotermitis]